MTAAAELLSFAAALAAGASGALLIRRALRAGHGDAFARIFSARAIAGTALLVAAAGLVATPYVIREATKRCTREELVNVFVGRVSQAQRICVEYGDGSTDAVRAAFVGIRFSPPEPTREAPFTVVMFGLESGERVQMAIAPVGIGLQPTTLTADRAGEARTDFRIPSGASPEWLVVGRRASGEPVAAAVPLPPAGSDPLGRVTQPPFAPPTPDPEVTVSTCAPARASVGTTVRCTFVGLAGEYATFSRTDVRTGTTIELRFVDVVRPNGRTVYAHTYTVDPGEWIITARTPAGSESSARFTVTAP